MKQTHAKPKIGRPLSFDREAALEQAMLAFWRHGYEATSISHLTQVMGVSAPSIYGAFGDKKRLFLEAASRYAGSPDALAAQLATSETAREAVRLMLVASATRFTGETTPAGCLLASATASVSDDARDVQAAITELRHAMMARVRERIAQDVTRGILPPATRPAALAATVIALIQGMSVLARDGATRDTLIAMADTLLSGWPT